MKVAIIVPTHNRKEKLSDCLGSLLKQNYSGGLYEIIVVDDGSSDGTAEMVKELSVSNANIRYLYQSNKGPAAARNLGIRQSSADIVAFSDNDCVLSPSWIRDMLEAHEAYPEAIAIGGATKANTANIKAVVSQSLSDGAIEADISGTKQIIFFPTCNVSFKRKYIFFFKRR